MKFHEYETMFDVARRTCKGLIGMSVRELYVRFSEALPENAHNERRRLIECDWYEAMRPYYKLYPSIIPALLNVKLDIPLSCVATNEISLIAIRLPEGHSIGELPGATAALSGWFCKDGDVRHVLISERGDKSQTSEIPRASQEWSIDSLELELMPSLGAVVSSDGDTAMFSFRKIAIALRLLENDPSIITPDVLAKDRDEYERTTDEEWKRRAEERARRRGVIGWNVGAEYEVCPHYRRPHFALRHTGKGGTVPRIVPVKGAVVHRSRLTEVPTGYILPDGTEVEHGKVVREPV